MNFLKEDNILHIFLNQIGDLILANLLFILFSIPIITIGPALTALYTVLLRKEKGNLHALCQGFVSAFFKSFKTSIAIWLGILAVGICFAFNITFLWNTRTLPALLLLILSFSIIFPFVLSCFYIFPVIAFFDNTWRYYIKLSFFLAIRHIPVSIVLFIVSSLAGVITYTDIPLLPLYAFLWFFIGFALLAFLQCKLLYPIFLRYLHHE